MCGKIVHCILYKELKFTHSASPYVVPSGRLYATEQRVLDKK